MKIINIDAQEQIAKKIVDIDVPRFVLDVVRPLEEEQSCHQHHAIICGLPHLNSLPHSAIRKFEENGYENIVNLIHTIPIYLRDTHPEKYNVEQDIVDLLGAYYPNRRSDNPYIELYLSDIDRVANGNELHFKWIFTKVLIHELAHASLDIFNNVHCRQTTEQVAYCTQFGKWREESMANAITLHIVKDFNDKDFYDFCKQFMLAQPSEYALGVLMKDFDYWDFRSVIDGKENGVNSHLQQEWLQVAQHNPTSQQLHCWNEYLSSQYVYVYHGEYYTEESKLVFKIVHDFLNNCLTSGRKYLVSKRKSIDEFKALFPRMRNQGGMSYEPSDQVKGDTRYTEVQFADGSLSLYYFWNNELLHAFIKNIRSKIELVEYKNY